MQATLDSLRQQLRQCLPTGLCGSVVRSSGMTVEVAGFPAPVGALVAIERQSGGPLAGEVIGFHDDRTLVYLLDEVQGLRHGNRVRLVKSSRWIKVGGGLLGRVINARGQAIDGRPQPALVDRTSLDRPPPAPVARPRIDEPLSTGIRAIDGLLTCGKGQRMGIFSGSGVGKSITLGMMARYTAADVNVVALVGERGREVNEFIRRDLGPALAKTVLVVATSDEPALERVQAAFTATSVAEYFRDLGRDVLLVMDSLTRLALAQREIGLAAGEPPTTRGFPPSVFAMLPKLLERAGRAERGSITGFYSVLVEGDDPNEPIADCVRGLLDGHTWLSRKLAARGHYPAIELSDSVSRLMIDVADDEHREAARSLRELLAAYRECEDLISVGAYRRGTNPTVDRAIDLRGQIDAFLRQCVDEGSNVTAAREALLRLMRCDTVASTDADGMGG
jgi:flagellum-specific ATP synthase